MPGYEGAVNSAFESDGSLRPDYLARVERVIRACDRHGLAVILGLYYQRQSKILRDDAAVRAGVAGRGIANPIAMILSAAYMLEWQADPHCLRAAARIRAAVVAVLSDHHLRTADLGGPLSTRAMTDAVLAHL